MLFIDVYTRYLIHSQSTVEYTLDITFFWLQLGYMWKVASIVKFWMRYWRKGSQYDLSSEDFRQCRYQVISVFFYINNFVAINANV